MKKKEKHEVKERIIIAVAIIIIGVPFFFTPPDVFTFGVGALAGIAVFELFEISRGVREYKDVLLTVVFAVYLFISLFLFCRLRFSENGLEWLLFGVFSVGAFDAASYLGGRKFGKHKIVARISPKKTVEGVISGFAGVIVVSLIVSLIVRKLLFPLFSLQIAAVIIGIFAFLGDLFESFLKRRMRVKHSGVLLKSHGGLLDRIDSALAGIYGIYLLRLFFN